MAHSKPTQTNSLLYYLLYCCSRPAGTLLPQKRVSLPTTTIEGSRQLSGVVTAEPTGIESPSNEPKSPTTSLPADADFSAATGTTKIDVHGETSGADDSYCTATDTMGPKWSLVGAVEKKSEALKLTPLEKLNVEVHGRKVNKEDKDIGYLQRSFWVLQKKKLVTNQRVIFEP